MERSTNPNSNKTMWLTGVKGSEREREMETAAEEGLKTLVYINAMPISIEDCARSHTHAHHTAYDAKKSITHNHIVETTCCRRLVSWDEICAMSRVINKKKARNA